MQSWQFSGFSLWSCMHLCLVVPLLATVYLVPIGWLRWLHLMFVIMGALYTVFLSVGMVQLNHMPLAQLPVPAIYANVYARIVLFVGATLLALGLGVQTRTYVEANPTYGVAAEEVFLIEGVVLSDSKRSFYGGTSCTIALQSSYTFQGTQVSATGRVSLSYSKEFVPLYRGQLVRVYGKVAPATEGEIIPDGRLFFGKTLDLVSWNSGWLRPLYQFRAKVVGQVQQKILRLPTQGSELLLALLLGRRFDPQYAIFTLFRIAGAPHLLALSGMHLAIMAGLISKLFGPLLGAIRALVLSMVVVLCYLFLAGFTPSLVRGAIFYILIGVVKLKKGKVYPFHLLVLTLIIQIALVPYTPQDISFQLSYVALGGILLLAPRVLFWFRSFSRRLRWLRNGLAGGIAAQCATVPVTLYHFGTWYPGGILAGVALLPFVVVFIWFGLVLLLIPDGVVLQWSCWLFDRVYFAMVWVAEIFTYIPGLEL